jgi:hypothetical protein
MPFKNFVLFGLFFLSMTLHAQTDFRSGYIIKNQGDTLYGLIDYRADLKMSRICKFKNDANETIDYRPNDILAYRIVNSKFYISKMINDRKSFLEFLINGKVKIYYLKDNTGGRYYIDKENEDLSEITNKEAVKHVAYQDLKDKKTNHIGLLLYFMQDAPQLQSRIKYLEKPEHHNLIELAEDYHNTLNQEEKPIIYERQLPSIRILPEIITGATKYSDFEDLKDKLHFNIGVIGHIWMPKISEKIYFRTGLIFSQLEFENEKYLYYQIPFQLEYIYPKGTFRPRLAYGLNLYYPLYSSVSFNIGTNIQFTEKFFLSATTDIEFNPRVVVLPKDLYSYSFKLGLFMNIN